MSDLTPLVKPDRGESAHSIHLVTKDGLAEWLLRQPAALRGAVAGQRFRGAPNSFAIVPGEAEEDWSVVAGVADPAKLGSWCLAELAEHLPAGAYRLHEAEPGAALLGWAAGQYRFDTYRSELPADRRPGPRVLLTGAVAAIELALAEARALTRVRDMVNSPPNAMGPQEMEDIARAIAKAAGATLTVTAGDALEQGYPLIHGVGRAATRARAPRLIELLWGDPAHPRVAIVGKGVAFDCGGLNIKSAAGMRIMKKDMGGAAHALALAELLMAMRLPVRLHCLVPAVENAIAGDAYRPGDVLPSRKGLMVEIDNTDAEGRLILADALVRAAEDAPELMIDFATLTGAARVALGPDLPALFARHDALADEIAAAGKRVDDPVWRLPLWEPYDDMFEGDVADTANSGGSQGGAITAALFLAKFVPATLEWAHLDTFAWRPSGKPGRPKGGDALSLRAVWRVLQDRFAAR